MKKIYSTLLVLVAGISFAQTINSFDFETWVSLPNTFGGMDPVGWKSTNSATAGGNIKAIERVTDPYSGTYALAIQPLITLDQNDTLTAAIVLGTAPLHSQTYKLDYEKGGQPIANKQISAVKGYYKYAKGHQTFDSAFAVVLLKDAFGPSTAGTGTFVFQPTENYIQFQINIQGNIGVADTLVIAFFYRSNDASPFSNASLRIDSLKYEEFVDLTALSESTQHTVRVFPNPCSEFLLFDLPQEEVSEIEIHSPGGLLYQQQAANSTSQKIYTEQLAPGLYLLKIKTASGKSFLKTFIKI